MKKSLRRVFMVVTLFIGLLCNVCYADVVPLDFLYSNEIIRQPHKVHQEPEIINIIPMIIIGIIIAVIVVIAIGVLINTKKKKDREENNEK